jgi:predicted SnoaL-like aldol condensation-catalyzing enzyme
MTDMTYNKALVKEFYEKVVCGGDLSRADRLLAEDYIQHNPNVPTGRDGFKVYFAAIHKRFRLELEILDLMAEGDMVVIHARQKIRAKQFSITVMAMDRFRIADGQIAEHWDVMSGAGRFDRLILELSA